METNQKQQTLQATLDSEHENTELIVNGKTYHLGFTDWHARELKKIGFDLYDWLQSEETIASLFGASPLTADVLVSLCEPDNETEFRRSLDSVTLEKARTALRGAVVNFFPPETKQFTLSVYDSIRVDMVANLSDGNSETSD